MPELTIGRMAKLYGMHRSSLYEAVEKGRVSTGFNGKGQRVIVLSEMIRVYGEPPGKAQQNPTPETDTPPTPPDYQELIEELRSLRGEVRELREAMRLLPAPGRDSQMVVREEQIDTQHQGGNRDQQGMPPEASESSQEPRKREPAASPVSSFEELDRRLADRLSSKIN